MQGRVILSHGRSLQSLAVAQSLAQHDIEVIGCDNVSLTVLSFSKYVKSTFVLPSPQYVTESEYIDALIEKIKAYQPPPDIPYVLIPVDWETKLYAKYHDRLAPYIQIAAPAWQTIEKVDPKDNLLHTAQQHQIRVPHTLLPSSLADLDANAHTLQFPVFIKIPDDSGGSGILKCADISALRAAYTQLAHDFHLNETYRPLVQEAVGDTDCCTTLLAEHGEVRAHITYRNIRAFPADGGAGAWRETIDNPHLIAVAQDLAAKLQWHGMAQIDFRVAENSDAEPWLIEINPRFFGGLFHSIASGVDYPWLLYQMTLGIPLTTTVTPHIGVQTRLPVTATLALFEEAIKNGINYDQLYIDWQKTWGATKEGDLKTAWRNFSQVAQHLFTSENKNLRQQWTQLKQAKIEGISWDDPFTSLGILVILGALIKNGQLPEEFNASVKKGNFKTNH
jgi:predicted ATP-grasp superfamily ATP-dependent carboligase